MAIESVTSQTESMASAKAIAKHAIGLIQFYLDTRMEGSGARTGVQSLVLLRDYLEPLSDRARTATASGRHALTARSEALGVDWPLTNPRVISASIIENADERKQAPSMDIETVKKLEHSATNAHICAYKRAYAAGILVMTYVSLRCDDVQKLRPFETDGASIYGTLIAPPPHTHTHPPETKTEKQHFQHWPWACPRMGIARNTNWAQPLLDMARRKVNSAVAKCPTFRLFLIAPGIWSREDLPNTAPQDGISRLSA